MGQCLAPTSCTAVYWPPQTRLLKYAKNRDPVGAGFKSALDPRPLSSIGSCDLDVRGNLQGAATPVILPLTFPVPACYFRPVFPVLPVFSKVCGFQLGPAPHLQGFTGGAPLGCTPSLRHSIGEIFDGGADGRADLLI
jgi:hypothetical protein